MIEKNNFQLHNFTEEETRMLQQKGLELLIYFKKICDENNLRFFLCGGCCIGSIRHGGFIPWDDDVDVFMLRDDYEKLCSIWNKEADVKRYELCLPEGRKNLFVTINDNNTTFIKRLQSDLDINQGLALDILPLDGYPNSPIQRKVQIFWALIYSLFCAQVIPVNHGKLVSIIAKFFLFIVPSKNFRRKIWRLAEKMMTKYKFCECNAVTELCSGPKYMRICYPKEIFESEIYKDFEGYKMPVPKGYDRYLKLAFGNYMELPPENERVMHHDVIFCDLNNSYKIYKGKKYFIK